MNLHLTDTLVDQHIRGIYGLAGSGRARRDNTTTDSWPRLRRRLGLTLVEAGLHLLVTAAPARSGRARA
jgi:hypothetical protein